MANYEIQVAVRRPIRHWRVYDSRIFESEEQAKTIFEVIKSDSPSSTFRLVKVVA